ncbi:MAG: SDR family oxidoreductase [Deltaproteobacteria bacterium]|nr:SDR family oxidoreductase [Deltaproteobacteria bacterium]
MAKIDFTGRVAIVTGAGAGLGRSHALELARRGAKVVVNDLGGSRDGVGSGDAAANKVVDEIKAFGGAAVPNYDSVATVKGGESIVKTAIDAFSKLDILVCNAGILRDKSFPKMDEEAWDAVIAVHLKGTYCCARPAFIHMREQGYGRIVLTTSAAGLIGNFGQANYGAAKMGICGLANVLKLEGAKYNIKVNVLAPGAATRMTEDVMPPEMFAKMAPELVTPAVVYMCSEQCQDTGFYINASAGEFSRSNIVKSPDVFIENPTAEDIAANWSRITDLTNAKFYNSILETIGEGGLVRPSK